MVAPSEQTQSHTGTPGEKTGSRWRALAEDIRMRSQEMAAYAKYLVSLETDRWKLTARRVGYMAAAGAIGLTIVVASLVVGAALLVVGLAGLLGMLLGSFWIGAAIVGGAIVLLTAGALGAGWMLLNRMAMRRLREKYEGIRREQRERFGRDVEEASHG